MALEQPDLVADGRRRHAELGGGALETELPRRGLEGAQFGQGWQLAHDVILDEFSSSVTELFDLALTGGGGRQSDIQAEDWPCSPSRPIALQKVFPPSRRWRR